MESSKIGRPRHIEDDEDVDENLNSKNLQHVIKNRSRPSSTPSSLILPPQRCNYFSSGFVHSCIVRETSPTHTRYKFMYQGICGSVENMMMLGEKQGPNNIIRIFDTSRLSSFDHASPGRSSSTKEFKLNKKSGNYLGKIQRDKNDKSSFSLFDSKEEKNQIAAIVYDSTKFLQQIKDGQPPRRLRLGIPFVRDDGTMQHLAPYLKNRMIENIKRNTSTGMQVFSSKGEEIRTFKLGSMSCINFNFTL